ncbi:hypothetical protein H2200_010604 [Cladophialophora chaetospira]|uniref:Uncharacterized protein n=1 Tax=Cladophialophora chaetospira TaxID=386627 RepID=A0AA38X1T5_9EURO|nr:hypothetical protein H2200_010604 [Cladophialophora chaetospira]
MAAANAVPIARTEAYFRLCNTTSRAPYIRSKARIVAALGVLGHNEDKVDHIMGVLEAERRRQSIDNLQTQQARTWRVNTTALLKTRFPEVFRMQTNGPEEFKFINETIVGRLIWCTVERARAAGRELQRVARRAPQVANDDDDDDDEDVEMEDAEQGEETEEEEDADENEESEEDEDEDEDEDALMKVQLGLIGAQAKMIGIQVDITLAQWDKQRRR